MSTDADTSAAFYCPVHQVRFRATRAEMIECDQASHTVGYGFPYDFLWTYCCACATFSPHGPANHNAQLAECPVCEREVAKRCLCHSCQVLTIESVVQIHRKVHSIDSNGVNPSCPGCGSAPEQAVLQHNCPELGISFVTARRSCLFCELQIGEEFVDKHSVDKDGIDENHTDEDLNDQELILGLFAEPAPEYETTYTSSWNYSAAPVPPKRRTQWSIGGAAALLSVAILIAVSVTNSNRTPPSTPTEIRIPEAPAGMVYIAGGEFMMGNNAGDEYERPAHKVSVAPFFMDVTEVTCEQYLKFLTATVRRDPRNWTNQNCRSGSERLPVTGVDWNDAKAYAEWSNKRLPTEQEWEFATRGVLGAMYPWGNKWRSNAANAGDSSARRLMDVGSYPNGKTSTGVMDLIGNAWEWTSSDVVVYPGGTLSSPLPQDVKVVRGASWREANKEATGTYRGYLHRTDAEDYSATGFRCVKDIGPMPSLTPKP